MGCHWIVPPIIETAVAFRITMIGLVIVSKIAVLEPLGSSVVSTIVDGKDT